MGIQKGNDGFGKTINIFCSDFRFRIYMTNISVSNIIRQDQYYVRKIFFYRMIIAAS